MARKLFKESHHGSSSPASSGGLRAVEVHESERPLYKVYRPCEYPLAVRHAWCASTGRCWYTMGGLRDRGQLDEMRRRGISGKPKRG